MGNTHPRFFAWYMGGSNFTGALADFLAAIEGSNLGGGDTAAAALDGQVIDWMKALMGFPETAGGTLTSGGSMANMVALTVARNAMAGVDVRAEGITNLPKPLRFYTSDQAHSAHQKAIETLGLGSRALRQVPTDAAFRMDMAALQVMIDEDRAAGCLPACIIATAGTTSTGSIDDLQAIAALCKREGIWFHIDGCIGAFIRLAPRNGALVKGLDQADSLALDPHKWLQTPFECGCALVRNPASSSLTPSACMAPVCKFRNAVWQRPNSLAIAGSSFRAVSRHSSCGCRCAKMAWRNSGHWSISISTCAGPWPPAFRPTTGWN